VALREGKRRLLMVDDQARAGRAGSRAGDQLLGGFTRDGKKALLRRGRRKRRVAAEVGMDASRK